MSHKASALQQHRPLFRTRETQPGMNRTKEGVQILCPFCIPTHAISPGEPSVCGTNLVLLARQDILPSRIVRMQGIKCLKCHEGGGEMVQYMNGFVHLKDCDPQTRLLPQMPRFSPWAGLVYRMPARIRAAIERRAGRAQAVEEIDANGEKTGKTLGHFFMKINQQGVPNG